MPDDARRSRSGAEPTSCVAYAMRRRAEANFGTITPILARHSWQSARDRDRRAAQPTRRYLVSIGGAGAEQHGKGPCTVTAARTWTSGGRRGLPRRDRARQLQRLTRQPSRAARRPRSAPCRSLRERLIKRPWLSPKRWAMLERTASDPNDFDRLAGELAKLPASDRARIVAEATRRAKKLQADSHFRRPSLRGGNEWVGGGLSREELYGDDGR
jgi:hypothetical protein